MEALEAINTRRSIRVYEKKRVPQQIIKKLIEAGRNAPSAFNDQPWNFVTITKQETKDKIVNIKSQLSKFIAQAPLVIACCYDKTKSHTKEHNLENVAVAAENILLAAHAQGLGACYVTGFDSRFPEIKKSIEQALRIPKQVQIVCLITIGYPAEKPKTKKMRPLSEVWHKENYN